MEIELKEISVRELTEGYEDNDEEGVVGYGGKLDIRPPYQREFIYKGEQRDAVIDTLKKDYPLNIMYWAVRDDNNYEVIDGQQRTMSICQYVEGEFSFDKKYFHNLDDDEKKQILDYTLTVYLCSGKNKEKLDWFETINIAGEKLTDQELLNAVYAGSWVSAAKIYFSKRECPAYLIGSKYLTKSPIRQEYLETAIKWISKNDIEDYMAIHHRETSANELWEYFVAVIDWVQAVFPKYRKEMKGLEWGFFYNKYKEKSFDSDALETRIAELMKDELVERKKGIYPYILTGEESGLHIRAFSDAQKRGAFETQGERCALCEKKFDIEEMQGDHIKPWSKGGKTTPENCQMLCKMCNLKKSNI